MRCCLQWASFERDQLAARYPAMESALKTLCGHGLLPVCAPPHRGVVAIDQFNAHPQAGPVLFGFDLVVKNSEPMAVAMPALELSLTDSRDKEIARRVFLPKSCRVRPRWCRRKGGCR
ncbi:MAG: DUF3426 domain-containing protein [Burkholderiaceae bacterium]